MLEQMTRIAAVGALALGLAACNEDPAVFSPGELLAVTTGAPGTQRLIGFDRLIPGTLRQDVVITGLTAGDTVIGLDIRPSDGTLFALARNGTVGRLYTVASRSGVATVFCALSSALNAASNYGVDFNPAVAAVAPATISGALRIVDDTTQNMRVTPPQLQAPAATCTTTPDTALDTAGISAAGYTNSVAGTVNNTSLFYVDSTADNLRFSQTPNGGVTTLVGALTMNIDAVNGFNITGSNNAIATLAAPLTGGTVSTIFNVNIATGAATVLGTLPAGTVVTGLTSSSVQ